MSFRIRALAALTFIFVLATVLLAAPEWKKAKRDFEDRMKSTDAAERCAALDSIAGVQDWDMVKTVLEMMVEETETSVHDAAVGTLATITENGPLKRLVKECSDKKNSNQVKTIAIRALARIRTELAEKEFMRILKDKKDVRKVYSATEAIERLPGSGPMFDAVVDNLNHEDKDVRVASAWALDRCEDENRAMDALINRLDGPDGRVKHDINQILKKRMPDTEGYDNGVAWRQAWNDRLAQKRSGGEGTPQKTVVETDVPTYYRVPIYSKNIVFVIDRTGSMDKPIDPKVKEKLEKDDFVESGGEEEKKEEKKKNDLPWGKIDTKMDLAKEELIRAIKALPDDVYFNVLFFHVEVVAVEDKLIPATSSNKKKMIAAVEDLVAEAGTDRFFDAIRKATTYTRAGQIDAGELVLTGDESEQGSDTIFFLTDGSPTVDNGMTGMPRDQIDSNVKDFMEIWQKTRAVVNTIGIGHHPKWLLQKLANDTGGVYVDLSFD